MSHVTDIILITGCFDFPNDSFIDKYKLIRVDEMCKSGKAMQCTMYIAAINYLDIDVLLDDFQLLKLDDSQLAQILIKDEHDDVFKPHRLLS
jgi:hypothetical protein